MTGDGDSGKPYALDDQIGFVLRQAHQRHTAIFAARMIGDLTPTQFAALARLHAEGPVSQNQLGRLTAMDVATIKGVVDRLIARGLVATSPDAADARRRVVALTDIGHELILRALPVAAAITAETLEPLAADEQASLLAQLARLR